MKAVSLIYGFMLFMCVIAGSIVALMCKYSLWWGALFLFIVTWIWFPLAELRDRVSLHFRFSVVLFAISFAILLAIVVAITLLVEIKSFLSIMGIVTVYCACLMTFGFMLFMFKHRNTKTVWIVWELLLKIGVGNLRRFFCII